MLVRFLNCLIFTLICFNNFAFAEGVIIPPRYLSDKSTCIVYDYRQPYQFIKSDRGVVVYKGLDIDVVESVIGGNHISDFKHLDWHKGLEAIEQGSCDILMGALFSKARENFAYYSVPYRTTEHRYYYLKKHPFKFKTISRFTRSNAIKKMRIGVLKNGRFANPILNQFIKNNSSQFTFVTKEPDLVNLLLEGKIDGFFAEKTEMEFFLWHTKLYENIGMAAMPLGRENVHFLLSKKSITPEQFHEFNANLKTTIASSHFKHLVRTYRIPMFISMTTQTNWYQFVEILGTVFYAFSGLILARQARFSLTGAFILAMLPGIGGGLMRDVILDRVPATVFRTPVYFLTVVVTTLVVYLFLRLVHYFPPLWRLKIKMIESTQGRYMHIVRATDSIGLAVFTIMGVMVAFEVGAEPLLLWAPVLAVLSSTGGGILRDFFVGRDLIRTFFYESSLIWSLLLTSYIFIRTDSITSIEIFYVIMATFIGIICTRLIVLHAGWHTANFWPDAGNVLFTQEQHNKKEKA